LANQECGTIGAKGLCKSVSKWKKFIKFFSSEIFPKQYCLELAIFSCLYQVRMVHFEDQAFRNLETMPLSSGQAFTILFPPILWNAVFIVNFVYALVYIVSSVQSWVFRVPIISMLCLNHIYGLLKWVVEESRFNVLCYSFRLNGILFASLGVLGFILLYHGVIMLMVFASWRCRRKIQE